MLLSYNKLKQLGIELELDVIVKQLIDLGHEVETIDVLSNDNIIIGHVKSLKKHENADKLNVAQVDVKKEVLQIVCGASNLREGMNVAVAIVSAKLLNGKIKKSKIRGTESNGMICSLNEIGLAQKFLEKIDNEGIYNFDKQVEIGTNAIEALNLNDQIIDVSLTANRGDCLSYLGIVRDLKAKNDQQQTNKKIDYQGDFDSKLEIENHHQNTLLLSAIEIKNVDIKTSPDWLRVYLGKHHIKSQNNIVDLTNYVMLELGIPVHAYDSEKIKNKLIVSSAINSQEFIALDGNKYQINNNCLVIRDDEKVVSLASVIGSNETKITSKTTTIILECGIFDHRMIRKTSQIIGKKTDASIRGEKGVDYQQVEFAFALFKKQLLQINSEIKTSKIKRTKFNKPKACEVTLFYKEIKMVLGIEIKKIDVEKILINLGFEKLNDDNEKIVLSIPSWRFDIVNSRDLIEELIRVYSMDEIKTSEEFNTFVKRKKIIDSNQMQRQRKLEQLVLKSNLHQVISYSLISKEMLTSYDGDLTNAVKVMMPISKNHEYYRQNLIPSLLEIAEYNFLRQAKQVNIFEIANVYHMIKEEVIEQNMIAGLVGGEKQANYQNSKLEYDFFDLKAVVEKILGFYQVKYQILATNNPVPIFNQYAQADIFVNQKKVGEIGLIKPQLLPKIKYSIIAFEINVLLLNEQANFDNYYQPFSEQPKISRDITINSLKTIEYKEIIKVFDKIKYLKEIKLIDKYDKNDEQALTFNLIFNDNVQKLTNLEIDQQMEKLFKQIEQKGYQ